MRKLMIPVTDEDEPNPFVVLSRIVGDNGFPVDGPHNLWESAPSEAAALMYAEHRAKSGYWVEVFKNLHYYAPQRNPQMKGTR